MTLSDEQLQVLRLEEAMDWFMRLRDEPADPDLLGQWELWLASSPAHAAAWARICQTWSALGEEPRPVPEAVESERAGAANLPRGLPGALPLKGQPIEPGLERGMRQAGMRKRGTRQRGRRKETRSGSGLSRRRLGLPGLAMLAAGLSAVILGPDLLLRWNADLRTAAGETEVVALPDGSRVTLAPQTALAKDFDDGRRHVRLLAGEAYFEVEHDTARPFVVETQDAAVRVLGTAFSVRNTQDGTRVELAQGQVALHLEEPGASDALSLLPGDVVTVERSSRRVQRSHVDPADIALWREGRLSVTDQPFGDVVSQIQRQHGAYIVVAQDELLSRRVTGLYDLRDPDKALDALVAPFGLKVRAVSPYLRIISSY